MATAGASRYSPFHLFFGDVTRQVNGDRDEAMRMWNNLEQRDRREYERRSELLKEALKKASHRQERISNTSDPAFENYKRLSEIARSEDLLRRTLKLVSVQYSAHHKVAVGDTDYEETRHFPNEISVVSFSFVGGVEKEDHQFVRIPDEDIPAYCKAEMKDRYEECHFIPYDEEEIRRSELAPVEPVATNALMRMFGTRDEEEMMTFCLSEDREVVLGSVKTLAGYALDPEDAREFLRRSRRIFDLEDLTPLLLSRPGEARDELAGWFKDKFADDVQSAFHCRCAYHRSREETEVHCTLLRCHSALHAILESSASDLEIQLTRRHLHVDERKLDRCSASFYAEFPEKAPADERLIWMKIPLRDEDSPVTRQLRFLASLRDPAFDGEDSPNDDSVSFPTEDSSRGRDSSGATPMVDVNRSGFSVTTPRFGRGRGFSKDGVVEQSPGPRSGGFGRGRYRQE